ncbi:DinB family protein [Candidatus Zixiibacteriota bacterium]
MSYQIPIETFTTELYDLLDETFEHVHGIYIDKNTSLFETLDTISAEEASRPVADNSPSIAGKVEHIRFYLRVLEGCIQKKEIGKIDWKKSWQLKEVTPEEWEILKNELKETYQSVLATMKSLEVWEGEDDIGASLGILAHTAYHLGAIRQALRVIR